MTSPAEETTSVVVVDLSQDLEKAPSSSNNSSGGGAILVDQIAKANPFIRTALVLERGKIVAEYVRSDIIVVDEDDDAVVVPHHPVYSVTKSWTSLLMGILLESSSDDDPRARLNATLGDIWPDDDDEIWTDVPDVSFRQNVTIESLLTMTSGLISNPGGGGDLDSSGPNGTAGGASLSDSLALPLIARPGDFSYLGVSNILSYALHELSNGTSPRELLEERVLPAFGVKNNSEMDWWRNRDGMEYSYHGLSLTAHQMAKFGQLYLQGGLASPTERLVSEEWIMKSASNQVKSSDVTVPGNVTAPPFYYGYLFWGMNEPKDGELGVGDYYCALGFGGQDICVHPRLQRVVVQQADISDSQITNLLITLAVFNESVVFLDNEGGSDDPSMGNNGTLGDPPVGNGGNETGGSGAGDRFCPLGIFNSVLFLFLMLHFLGRNCFSI